MPIRPVESSSRLSGSGVARPLLGPFQRGVRNLRLSCRSSLDEKLIALRFATGLPSTILAVTDPPTGAALLNAANVAGVAFGADSMALVKAEIRFSP